MFIAHPPVAFASHQPRAPSHLAHLLAHLPHDARLDNIRDIRVHIRQDAARPGRMLDALHQIDLAHARHKVGDNAPAHVAHVVRTVAAAAAQSARPADAVNVVGHVQRHVEVDNVSSLPISAMLLRILLATQMCI